MWKSRVKKSDVQVAEGQLATHAVTAAVADAAPAVVPAELVDASSERRADTDADKRPGSYTLTAGAEFRPGKGIASELHQTLGTLGSATAQQLVDALLGSGAFQRVAPKAAEARPLKVVTTVLNQWLAKGVVVKA